MPNAEMAQPHCPGKLLRVALPFVGLTAAYALLIRPWHLRWGARRAELEAVLPGDEVVSDPVYRTTRAVTVRAPVERVWPWLVQMGYQRGGLYSYDRLDRLFGYLDRPSATEILAEFQHLEAGDVIPLGKGPDWPVHSVEPNRALVLHPHSEDFNVSWAFVLTPEDSESTRLISRVRGSFSANALSTWVATLILEPVAFLMERSMLLGIKRRAERHG